MYDYYTKNSRGISKAIYNSVKDLEEIDRESYTIVLINKSLFSFARVVLNFLQFHFLNFEEKWWKK